MKTWLMSFAAFSLVAGAAAAQPDRHDQGDRHGDHDRRDYSGHDRRGDRWEHGSFRYGGREFGRLHGPAWDAPRGWTYERYAVGAMVPRLFLSGGYAVDPFAFGIRVRPAHRGYRWIRVRDDLLLVNWRTGRVVEVVPDVFY